MLISLVIKIIFQHWLCSLNLYLNINVWICIFMWKKTSLKESKVDSRTHFAVDDLLTRDMTFWWSLKSVSQETHCPLKVVTCPNASATPGPTYRIFWVIEIIRMTWVFLKANFRDFEGFGISRKNTDQIMTHSTEKCGLIEAFRKISFDNQWGTR